METAEVDRATARVAGQQAKGIGEVQYGKWTNRPFKSLVNTKLWRVVQQLSVRRPVPRRRDPAGDAGPGSRRDREARAAHPKQKVCIVSHADVIKLITAHYLGVHIDLFQRIDISPGIDHGVLDR